MQTIQCVLFDLDGTLLDSLADLAGSMNTVLRRHGYPVHPIDAYRYFVGEGVVKLVERSLPKNRKTPEKIAQCADEMRREYAGRWAETTKPYAGIPELLDALSQRGIPMAILSNKPDDFTREIVKSLLGKWDFAMVAGAREGIPRKPDPAGALAVADKLRIPPDNFLFVGDSNIDMHTARGATMFAVGVLWGFRTEEELKAGGAQALLARPSDLCRLLVRGNQG
ncbi:HAD family hydrolase [Thiovibrio sp. JS02]